MPLHGRTAAIGSHPDPRHRLRFAAEGISCVSAKVCLVVGQNANASVGEIAEIVNGKPTAYRTVPDAGGINGISCPSPTSGCEAVGYGQSPSYAPIALAVSRAGVPRAVKTVTSASGDNLDAVSCFRSIASCEAVGQALDGNAVALLSLHNGQPATPRTVSVADGAFIESTAIACLSATRCRAVGSYPVGTGASQQLRGFAITVNSGRPSAANTAASFGLNAISCPRPGHCEISGSSVAGRGFVAALPARTVTSVHRLKTMSAYAVSCPSTKTCTVVGSTGGAAPKAALMTLAGGKPGPIKTVPGAAVLTCVSTPTTKFYEAIGQLLLGSNDSQRLVTSHEQ